jgi:hypothetical protein
MAQFITLTGRGKIGRLRVNLDRLVAYYGCMFRWDKKLLEGSKLDVGDGTPYDEQYEVLESPEDIDRMINPAHTP